MLLNQSMMLVILIVVLCLNYFYLLLIFYEKFWRVGNLTAEWTTFNILYLLPLNSFSSQTSTHRKWQRHRQYRNVQKWLATERFTEAIVIQLTKSLFCSIGFVEFSTTEDADRCLMASPKELILEGRFVSFDFLCTLILLIIMKTKHWTLSHHTPIAIHPTTELATPPPQSWSLATEFRGRVGWGGWKGLDLHQAAKSVTLMCVCA